VIDIGITMGDPGGVGPEVLLQALGDEGIRARILPRVFGDGAWLRSLAGRFGWKTDFEIHQVAGLSSEVRPGKFTEEGGRASMACLETAADALSGGEIAALVTAPVHKRAFAVCHAPGPGHTEWLTARFGAGKAVMMLCGPRLRVILATTHVALRDLPRVLRREDLVETVAIASRELTRYFFPKGPRLALAALNPHGEEDGLPGLEEREILSPAVEDLQKRDVNIVGPKAGDTVFAQAAGGAYDAVVALYHDQGLAPLKTLHPHDAVNVTLGLGVVRTSPDHGVAYDIAHQGIADPTSMREAILLAASMAGGGQP
jgi:4-hydroxythreonine-4-phosphate dehydrogenase